MDSFGYLNSLSSSSSTCRTNARNELVLGCKKEGGINEVAFVSLPLHVIKAGDGGEAGRGCFAAWMCGCFH